MPSTTLTGTTPVPFPDDVTSIQPTALSNVPTAFGNMAAVSFDIDWTFNGTYVNDSYVLAIRIMSGATVLAAGDALGAFVTFANRGTDGVDSGNDVGSFPYVNTVANKATWDSAVVEIRQTYTANGAGDSCFYEVTELDFSIDYVNASVNIVANVAQLEIDTFPVTVGLEFNIEVATADLSIETFPVTVGVTQIVEVGVAELVLETFPVQVGLGTEVAATVADLVIETFPVGVFAEGSIGVTLAELTLETFPVQVDVGDLINVEASVAELILETFPVTVRDYPLTQIEEPYTADWILPAAGADWDGDWVDGKWDHELQDAEWSEA